MFIEAGRALYFQEVIRFFSVVVTRFKMMFHSSVRGGVFRLGGY